MQLKDKLQNNIIYQFSVPALSALGWQGSVKVISDSTQKGQSRDWNPKPFSCEETVLSTQTNINCSSAS